jgi:uncharacterized protein
MENVLPWYIGGPLLGLIVPLVLILREKQLGISSSLKYVGSLFAFKVPFFNYDRKKDLWQIQFALGIIISAVLFNQLGLISPPEIESSKDYVEQMSHIYELDNWLLFLIGGLLVGFGARYANGCTAGHCIMGNAQLSLSSLITTICFFIGGLVAVHIVLPLIEIL